MVQPNKHRLMIVAMSFAALLNMSSLAAAQDTNERIAAAFALIEFDGTADRAEILKALGALTQRDIAELCEMLVEPGTGDDTKPRMALHAIALDVVAGVDAQHARFTAALGEALQSAAPKSAKGFLIRQLQFAGDRSATPHLAAFLADDALSGAAARALLAIGGREATAAIRSALLNSSTTPRVAIIQAVGALRDDTWFPTLLDAAGSSNDSTRGAALDALAEIGRREATDALLAAFAEGHDSHSWQLRAKRTAMLLRFASRLCEERHTASSAEICRVIMDAREVSTHERSAALRGLADALGVKAVNAVVQALISDDAEYRAAAMHVAVDLPGSDVTGAYAALLSEAPAAVSKTILDVLARRGDETAFDAAADALRHPDQAVRLAAVRAVAALGRERAVDALAAFLDSDRKAEVKAGIEALVGIATATASERIASAITDAPDRTRIALLTVLARRGARQQLAAVFREMKHADADVRLAAIAAAGELADDVATQQRLVSLLTAATAQPERTALETALAAVSNRLPESARRAAPILAAVRTEDVDDYCSLLRVLGRIGGNAAFAAVHRAAIADSRKPVQDAGYRALSTWPQAKAASQILELARAAENVNHHVLAMRAFARLVSIDNKQPSAKKLKLYRSGMDAARRVDEQKHLLSKIGELKTDDALQALEPYLDQQELSSEAASAMITAADGLLPGGWQAARDAIEKILAISPPDGIRSRADALQKRVAEFEDYITGWLTAGPYSVPGKKGNEILDTVFAPEQPGATDVKWQAQPVTKDPGRYWRIDMTRVFNGPNRVGYLFARIHSAKDQPVRLELGSDDGLKVWLNGENIHTNNTLRGCERAQDIVKATLKKGVNELLLKVSNNGGGWAACVRVRAPDGGRLSGVYAKADGPPE